MGLNSMVNTPRVHFDIQKGLILKFVLGLYMYLVVLSRHYIILKGPQVSITCTTPYWLETFFCVSKPEYPSHAYKDD